jgi:hypothetical protein
MKTLAFAALFVGATGLLACGGDDDSVHFADAGIDGGGTCNPVTQTGCDTGQKCSWLVVSDEPFLGRTACVTDGTVAVGDACTEGAPGETTGFDDCAAGGLCIHSKCKAICSVDPPSCTEGYNCATYENVFSDDTTSNTGVCDTVCDPINPTECDENEGCYLSLFDGIATCAGIPAAAADLRQNDECLAASSGGCYLNGCAAGFTGFIFVAEGQPRLCTAYCSPVNTYLNDPLGKGYSNTNKTLIAGADADGADPYACTGARVDNQTGLQCRFLQTLVDENNNYLDYVSAAYGVCSPLGEIYGDCTKTSEEKIWKTYDVAVAGGGDGNMAVQTFCMNKPLQCAVLCEDIEHIEGLFTAYCAGPGAGGAVCSQGAQGAARVSRTLHEFWKNRIQELGVPSAPFALPPPK